MAKEAEGRHVEDEATPEAVDTNEAAAISSADVATAVAADTRRVDEVATNNGEASGSRAPQRHRLSSISTESSTPRTLAKWLLSQGQTLGRCR